MRYFDGSQFVASELKDPIWHSLEWQIGSFSSEATILKLAIMETFSIQIACNWQFLAKERSLNKSMPLMEGPEVILNYIAHWVVV